ncbi:Neutral and basic amino acid transport protein rBAT [Arthrobotrys megalospora]
MASSNASPLPWWKTAVGYHIYVPSFSDSNGDGIGDIPGILSRLPYLKSLGVDLIWLSPFYASPQHDMGYDISDYKSVHPPYGTVTDVQRLIDAAHMHGLKIIFDLVVNHTSHLHEWFISSRASKSSTTRDWYHWRPAKYDEDGNKIPPNNWMSVFGGSAWEWDDVTEEYYLHIYLKEQPDLNWSNPELRKAVFDDAIRFWLDKGVDGFRIDTVCIYAKDTRFPDAEVTNPKSEFQLGRKYYADLEENFEYLKEMRDVFKGYEGREFVMIGEYSGGTTPETARRYCGEEGPLDSGFHKQLLDLERTEVSKWVLREPSFELSRFMEVHTEWQEMANKELGSWTTAYLENHDVARSVSRFADDSPEMRAVSAKLLAVLMATSSGTLFIYQGQEIGMTSMPKDWGIEEYKDNDTLRYYESVKEGKANGETLEYALSSIRKVARDHGRTPMQWDGSSNAGFTTAAKPWMRVNDNNPGLNVEQQESDQDGALEFWRKVLKVRKQYPELFIAGRFEPIGLESSEARNRLGLFWKKSQDDSSDSQQRALVVLNFSSGRVPLEDIVEEAPSQGEHLLDGFQLLISTYPDSKSDTFEAYEGRVYIESS